ncbi:hypothetical protein ACIB24_01135 [Spongisporangium articulatum]|uniref:Uncharacterized protein n=1 Tax=Spongisporangium articulatum TaxID=3362603 RepID=A0ABW8AH41_9ACTN
MDGDVTAALVTGGLGLVVAVGSGIRSELNSRRQVRVDADLEKLRSELELARNELVRQQADVELFDQYRRPLLAAAVELTRRLGNIRHRNFDIYLRTSGRRGELAVLTTLYRLASYLGWREVITRERAYLRHPDDAKASTLVRQLEDVATQLSSDGPGFGTELMLWKDEQRAVGGLMIFGENPSRIIGFEQFVEDYDQVFAPWLGDFAGVLLRPDVAEHPRLLALGESLDRLIEELDASHYFSGRY